MSYEKLLNTTGSSTRQTTAIDQYGVVQQTWVTSISSFECRIRPIKWQEKQIRGALGEDSTHVLFCLRGLDITAKDRITVDSVEYNVIFVGKDSSDHHMKIELGIPSQKGN